jgi:hypothetical protein
MAFNLRRGLQQAAEGASNVFGGIIATELKKQSAVDLEQLRAELERKRDERLYGQKVDFAKNVEQPFQQAQQEREFGHRERLQERGFEHAEWLQGERLAFEEAQKALDREHQTALAQLHEGAASARHRESIALQKAQLDALKERVTLQPLPDGRILKLGPDGRERGYLTDPATGAELRGPKNVSEVSKILAEGYGKIIASLEQQATKLDIAPQEKKRLQERIEDYIAKQREALGLANDSVPERSGASRINDPFRTGGGAAATVPATGGLIRGQISEPPYAQFLKLRRGGYYVDAPARSPAAVLNGRTGSREELLEALARIYGE